VRAGSIGSRRAAAAVASYSDVVPNASKSDSAPRSDSRSRVKSRRSWTDASNVKSATSSRPLFSWESTESYVCRAIPIFGPIRMG
jgi:hypothetical protein